VFLTAAAPLQSLEEVENSVKTAAAITVVLGPDMVLNVVDVAVATRQSICPCWLKLIDLLFPEPPVIFARLHVEG